MKEPRLTVVGTGIKFLSQLTIEAKSYIEQSSKVLYLINEPAIEQWIIKANPNVESLELLYTQHEYRIDNYDAISNYVLSQMEIHENVCLAVYGHPIYLSKPVFIAIERAKSKGYPVNVLPGISAEACLFADLNIDPLDKGVQSFEATDFLLYKKRHIVSSHLILWQVYVIGLLTRPVDHDPIPGIKMLRDFLLDSYDSDHEIILYEAAQYAMFKPIICRSTLGKIAEADIKRLSTLYIPPVAPCAPDKEVAKMLSHYFST